MYTRSYDEERLTPLPEGYSGVAFGEEPSDVPTEPEAPPVSARPKSGLMNLLTNGLSDVFGGGILKGGIGVEEILIIATAAFLFFNKDGDRECALMLLLLLFIS